MLRWLLATLSLWLGAPGQAQAPAPAHTDEAIASFIDGYVSNALDRSGIVGAGVVVVRDGRVILARGYGFADLESRRPVSVDSSLFRQASVSKLFIWVLAMQLVEEGRLDLDADINRYLDFPVKGKDGRPITFRHLMTHSAGFADRVHGEFTPNREMPLGAQLRANTPARLWSPGEVMAYSNHSTNLAAYIVQRLRGAPFQQLVETRIFAPLRMTRSTFAQPLPPKLAPLLVKSYAPGSRRPLGFEVVPLKASGALTASPADMARFTAALLSGGQGPGGRILQPQSVAAMMRMVRPVSSGNNAGFGLGMMVGSHRGVRYAGHGGNLPTTATYLQTFPDHGLGWTLSFSGQGTAGAANAVRANLVRAVIDRYLAPAGPPVTARGPSTAAEAAGLWMSARRMGRGPATLSTALGVIRLEAEANGTLKVVSGGSPALMAMRFLPQGRDSFAERDTGQLLTLERDPVGRVVRLGGISSVAALERAPGWYGQVIAIFSAAVAILVFAALAAPAGWAMRRGFKGSKPAGSSRFASFSLPAARVAVWIHLGTVAGWAAFLHRTEADLGILSNRTVTMALALASWLSILASLVILADAVAAWRDPSRGLPRRLGMAVVAVAALIMAALFLHFDLVTLSTDW